MIWALLLSCAEPSEVDSAGALLDTGTAAEEACDSGWNSWAGGFFTTYCTSCHHPNSANRHGAPEGMNFHTKLDAVGHLDRVRVRVLSMKDMPLGGGVPEPELVRLAAWADCVDGGP